MAFEVPTKSETRFKIIMDHLDSIAQRIEEFGLNAVEYDTLNQFKLRVNAMRFGKPPELEYPHWATAYNKLQEMLDATRRVPLPSGQSRLRGEEQEMDNALQALLPEEDELHRADPSVHDHLPNE